MSPARSVAWTLLAAAGFALAAPSVAAQGPKLPEKKPKDAAATEMRAWRDAERGGIPKENLKQARDAFKTWAKYFADVVAHPDVHKAPQELKAAGVTPPPTLDNGPLGILNEIDQYIEPVRYKGNREPFDYLREIGAAFDAPLKELIETNPDMIVRINAARLLAYVAKTGAPAHWPTVAALLADPKTPTGVKNYLFQAAAALLAAPDTQDPKIRHHAQVVDYRVKDAFEQNQKALGTLVKALIDCIDNPALILNGIPADRPDLITEDQLPVVGFVRHQAVKALAKVKFARVPGPDGKPLYPAYTLARVALSDPNLVPPPKPAEAADAVLGLCNAAPVEEQLKGGFKPIKDYNADVAAEAAMAGLVTFARPRAANAFDNSLPWRRYAAELGGAIRDWRPLFDPDYEPLVNVNRFNAALVPPPIEALNRDIVPIVLAPMDKTDNTGKPDPSVRVNIEVLQQKLGESRARPKRNTVLFAGVPQTTIEFPPPKKAAPPEVKKDGPPVTNDAPKK
jgi:hypothetical protein